MDKENPRASHSLGHYEKHQSLDSGKQRDNSLFVFIILGGEEVKGAINLKTQKMTLAAASAKNKVFSTFQYLKPQSSL